MASHNDPGTDGDGDLDPTQQEVPLLLDDYYVQQLRQMSINLNRAPDPALLAQSTDYSGINAHLAVPVAPRAFGRDVNYSSRFILRGTSPGDFLHALHPPEHEVFDRFPGYPKLAKVDKLKRKLTDDAAHEPLFVSWVWQPAVAGMPRLGHVLGYQEFDAILLNVPKGYNVKWLADLRLHELAATPSFLFIMVRESTPENLEAARAVMHAWGFRRCEDIVWLKSDFEGLDHTARSRGTLFADVKEHCLMGIRGTARRSTDGHLIHCNIDSDLIVSEEFNEHCE